MGCASSKDEVMTGKKVATAGGGKYTEIIVPGDVKLDHWTDMDWEQFQEIGVEDGVMWEALPADVKEKGEAFLG